MIGVVIGSIVSARKTVLHMPVEILSVSVLPDVHLAASLTLGFKPQIIVLARCESDNC